MISSTPIKKARPLSPHLQIYKPQLTSGLSIFHRITGVGLSLALPVFVWYLVALADGHECYQAFIRCTHSIPGQIILFGWVWAFCFHLCMGIRHLFWDMGLFLQLKQVYDSGLFAVALSCALTIALWYNICVWSP
jgi:succinate dehydrogenase / fumarate reductase cytochrome b subunit